MATITATSTNNWATAFPSVPTAADDVVIPSPYTVTIPNGYAAVARSFTVQSGGGITIANTVTATLAIGDGTAGAGNVAINISSGATVSLSASFGTWSLVSTSATQQTITSGGKTLPSININGAGSSYLMSDALTSSGTVTLTAGTFDTGNYSLTAVTFSSSNSNTRTFNAGSSTITLTSSNNLYWTTVTTTNLTFNCGTSTIVAPDSTSTAHAVFGGITIYNLTRTGSANKTVTFWLGQGTSVIISGTLTVNSNSATNRILMGSLNYGTLNQARGTATTVTVNGSFSLSNVDFADITANGSAGTWTPASGTFGDTGGNSGITMTTPATQTNTGATGSWSDSTKWTSRVPLPQDDVVINTGSGTITADMPRLGKSVNFTGFTGTASFNTTTELYGSLTLASGMTLGAYTQAITLAGRSSYTVTSAGKQFSNQIQFNGYGGTYTLQDALYTTQAITQFSGTFDTNNQTVTCLTFTTSGTITRVLTFGTSTINLTSTAATTVWSVGSSGLTMSATSSTIVIATASGQTRVFGSGGQTYGTITYTVANSPGALNITGSSTYGTINLASGRGLIPNASGVYAITGSITGSGSPNGYVYMGGDHYGASAPDSAALSIAGDMDFRQRMSFDSLTSAASLRIAGKFFTTGNQRTWRLYLTGGSGTLTLDMSTTGSDSSTAASSVSLASLGLSANTNYWIRFTREKSTGNVKFYYAADNTSMPSSWTQIGTTQVATTSNLFDSTALLTIGGEQIGTNSNPGRYYRSQLRNNILDDGTGIQFDADFTAKTFGADTFTESSSNAATVTIANNSVYGDGRIGINASSAGSVATLTKASGGPINTTSDYLVIKDIKVPQPYFFFAGANSVSVSGNTNISLTTVPSAPLLKQSAPLVTVSANTTGTVTYPAATTSGNLLCIFWGGATVISNLAASGWTLGDFKTGTGTSVGMLYKVADGTETSVAVTWTTSASPQLYAYEISGFTGTPTLDTFNESTSASATSLATGSATNSTAPGISIVAFSGNGSLGASSTVPTNSFQEDYNSQQATGSVLKFGIKPLTASAAQSTTFTWTTSRVPASVLVNFVNAVSAANHNALLLMGVG